jgi:hypothetical protein
MISAGPWRTTTMSRCLSTRTSTICLRPGHWPCASPSRSSAVAPGTRRKLPTDRRSRQDEATRAWNLHVALYYKAGGVPWRLQRNSTDFATCYVGIAFYKNSSRDTLETSVAQVFNQRGDGMIIRGGAARVSSDDRQPHLEYGDAHDLLVAALDAFRQEHRTMAARVVLHKTSTFTAAEIAGFQSAADERQLDALDMSWITNSDGACLFRPAPLRRCAEIC